MEAQLNQRYQQIRQLAQGSDSEVWQGFDTLRQLPVLIKAYLPHALQDWKRIQLIEREARILAQINHIEIPGFVDFFALGPEGQQTLYLVSYWVNGLSLSEKREQGWIPTLEEVLGIASKTLELLIYIHAFNPPLVHRDIKPSNLMVNQWLRVYLVDFGGAQEVLSSQGAGGSTLVGTVGYMAPEQLQGRAIPGTDLYGLGATLLELLTGEMPAEAGSAAQAQQLSHLHGRLGNDLIRWLQGLLAANPDQRYASAKEALRDLDLLLDRDFSQRSFFYPQNHLAQIPEIIHSLTLTERSAEDQALLAGSLLEGRYEVSDLLGAGTHSRVYSGQIRHNAQAIILKELCLERVSEWKNIELFEREMAIQQRLKHPRIPAYIDSFQIQEGDSLSWFLVTEAVDGETLDQRLERGWRPTDEMVWEIADQLLGILEYLHSQDPPLVHRDLKPSNVLITPDNQVWLIDFGAVQSRLWAQGGGGSTIIGTFGYMAPEQFSGQAWPQSDLYGLGATLIRLLSRRHPIEIPLEGWGLHFQPFVSCSDFYLAWLGTLLKPLYTQRFASASEARRLLQDAAEQGAYAANWLKTQQAQAPSQTSIARRKRLLPSQIRLDQVTRFLQESSLTVSQQGSQVCVEIPEDSQFRQRLRERDLQSLFPRDPENQLQIPVWRRSVTNQGRDDTAPAKILLMVLGPWLSVMAMLAGGGLWSEWQHVSGIYLLLLPLLGWGAAGAFFYQRYRNTRQQQAKGQILPLRYSDFYPYNNKNKARTKSTLLSNARIWLDEQHIRLEHEHFGALIHTESFKVPWSAIQTVALKPWQPDYPHWGQLLERRLYHLQITTVQPVPAYPQSLWATSSPAIHGPPDTLRLPLSETDAESLGQILQGLQRQYAGKRDLQA